MKNYSQKSTKMKKIKSIFLFLIYISSLFTPTFGVQRYNIVDLTSYLPRNYVTDASVDYTAYIQKGLDMHRVVKMPDFPICVNDKGLKISSNTEIYFQQNSKLLMAPTSKSIYAILWIVNVNNISIFSPNLEGDRDAHLNNKGEHGMGIHIMESSNIIINNPLIRNCWGDGIYIGGGKIPSSKILIKDGKIINNRRNGISITNGVSITIANCEVELSHGTNPMAGIDIEPNSPKNVINNILLEDVTTRNNKNWGIVLSLNEIYSRDAKDINISIINHRDIGSKAALCLVSYTHEKNPIPFTGSIKIKNPIWINNEEMIKVVGNNNIAPTTEIINIATQTEKTKQQRALNSVEKMKIKKMLYNKKNIFLK